MNNSGFLKLNYKDFFKGLLMAAFGAFAGALISLAEGWYTSVISNTPFHFDWNAVFIVTAGAAIAYIKMQLITNKNGEVLRGDPPITPPPTGGPRK